MAAIDKLKKELLKLIAFINDEVGKLSQISLDAQEKIFKLIIDEINRFEIKDGRYVVNQDYAKRIAIIEKKMRVILEGNYVPSVIEYLGSYSTIQDRNLALHKTFNDLLVEMDLISPARKNLYEQAEYWLLKSGLTDGYIQPAKYLLMQHITTGISIKESERVIKQWSNGELADGQLASGRKAPSLDRYAPVVAQNTAFQYHGTINDIIRKEYDLDAGIYTGPLVEKSRPLCIHLINLDRPIMLDELEPLIKKYPQGVIKGTNKENFSIYRGGYKCGHLWYPVRSSRFKKSS